MVHPISGRTLRRHQMPSTPQPRSFVSQDELNGLEQCGVLGILCHTSGSLLKGLSALRINRVGDLPCFQYISDKRHRSTIKHRGIIITEAEIEIVLWIKIEQSHYGLVVRL